MEVGNYQLHEIQSLIDDGRFQEALIDVNQILSLDSTIDMARYQRAMIHTGMEEYQQALLDWNYLLQKFPEYIWEFHYERGLANYELRQLDSAIHDLSNAVEIMSAAPQGHLAVAFMTRGTAYYEVGDSLAALSDLDTALMINPSSPHAYYIRGFIREYGFEDDVAAIEDFNKVLEFDSLYFQAYYERGVARYNLEEDEQACADFLKAYRHGIIAAIDFLEEICEFDSR